MFVVKWVFVRSKSLRHLPRRVFEANDCKAQWKERRHAKRRKPQRHPHCQLPNPDKDVPATDAGNGRRRNRTKKSTDADGGYEDTRRGNKRANFSEHV